MLKIIFCVLFGIMAVIAALGAIAIVSCMIIMTLQFVGTLLLNPFVYLFTGHNLKAYEEWRDMPKEDDFF
jgi:membrane protein YdbS with pleckstrin-like domain